MNVAQARNIPEDKKNGDATLYLDRVPEEAQLHECADHFIRTCCIAYSSCNEQLTGLNIIGLLRRILIENIVLRFLSPAVNPAPPQ